MLTRDEYVAKMKQRLDKWSVEIDTLEAKVHKTQEDAKVKYQEQLSALHAMRQEGEKKLETIKAATEDPWKQLKAETENVWEAFIAFRISRYKIIYDSVPTINDIQFLNTKQVIGN